MLVGVPKEIKSHEYRVGLVPASVREIVRLGGDVLIEQQAGLGIGISDEQYLQAGATIANDANEVFQRADLIVKVKEPQPHECRLLRAGQTLFTYLHLAPDPEQTQLLLKSGVSAIAYETVTDAVGGLPLLTPMSQVAGRMSIQAGAHCLEKAQHGRGILLGGVPGVNPAHVVIIGAGVVGSNALLMAVGLGAQVTVLDKSLPRLEEIKQQFGSKITTVYSTSAAIEQAVCDADLVIGGVLIPGAAAPKLVSAELIRSMRPGSVVVDVAIDQGGCFATSHPTTHQDPTYLVDNVVHYCVANMPGAVPYTSTFALNNATLPFILNLVSKGTSQALLDDVHFLAGLNVHQGHMTCEAVALSMGLAYLPARDALRA